MFFSVACANHKPISIGDIVRYAMVGCVLFIGRYCAVCNRQRHSIIIIATLLKLLFFVKLEFCTPVKNTVIEGLMCKIFSLYIMHVIMITKNQR